MTTRGTLQATREELVTSSQWLVGSMSRFTGTAYTAAIPSFSDIYSSGTMSKETLEFFWWTSVLIDSCTWYQKAVPVNVFMGQTAPSTQHLRGSWESEIGVEISEDTWAECVHSIQCCLINWRQLIQYKVIRTLHYSCVNLNSFYPSSSLLLKQQVENFVNAVWKSHCKKKIIIKVWNIEISPCFETTEFPSIL